MDLEESPRDIIEGIAAMNGVISDAILERAQQDPMIRRLVNSNQNLKEIANNSTFRLAEDLNSVPTHFVLECIQNADDNHYADGIEPFLRITINQERIQLDCNEIGFRRHNVEAICSVGKSTKSLQSGYIGEKGIGFKSVFKVAQHAYIYSPPFSFKFDKNRELGMITPVWVEEDQTLHTRHEEFQTTILLLPPSGENFSTLFRDFSTIAPTLLLFLRRLKRLEINLMDPPTRKILTSRSHNNGRLKTLMVEDGSSTSEHRYRIYSMNHNISTREERRQGVTSTEIVLAFPVNSEGAPEGNTQMVHAFLPVRNFGFKFLIQADFLVTSSRQDIDESKAWNNELRMSICTVFKQAILNFLSTTNDPLRYTWIRYLPRGISHEFWRITIFSIWSSLRESRVLESQAGSLGVPRTLERLSNVALDRDGRPLVGELSEYLSPRYSNIDWGILSELGVKLYSQRELLVRLYRTENEVLISRARSWHEDLAKCMESFENTQAWNDLAYRVRHRTLIPLEDGTWSSADDLETNPIYFREGNSIVNIPSDINLRLVKMEASENIHRKRFFRVLGVKDCNQREVAELILRKHHTAQPPPLHDAVIHSEYIFMLPPSIRDSLDVRNFWLYDESGRHARGDQLYIRANTRYSADCLLRGNDVSVRFLSPVYGTSNLPGGARQQFIEWLLNNTALTTIPRLKRAGAMSLEFIYILRHHSNEVIHILRRHWHVYQHEVNEAIRVVLGNHQVNCSDGGAPVLRVLKHSYLPDPRLKQKSSELCTLTPGVEFIMIEGYSVTSWGFLARFCAGNAPDLRFYLWVGIQEQFRRGCDIIRAKKLFQYISETSISSGELKALVRHTFSTVRMLRVIEPSSPNETRWVYTHNCVWDAPAGFRGKYSLKPLYGDQMEVEILMKSTLGINDATIREVVNDMISLRASDSYLMAAYMYLEAKLAGGAQQGDLYFLRESFERNMLILIPGRVTRLSLSQCVWGGPSMLHKTNIQPFYDNTPALNNFFTSSLSVKAPSWNDVLRQLAVLKSDLHTTANQVEEIYAYLSTFQPLSAVRNEFEENNYVYTKEANGTTCWRKPSECVWSAQSFLRSKVAISNSHEMTNPLAITFLRENLNIQDADLTDFVEDVRILRRGGTCDRNEIENLYRQIELKSGRRQSEIRAIFTSEPLVYIHFRVPPCWVVLDHCIWDGPRCLRTTPKLVLCYPDFRNLFCTILGVRNATSDTVIQELLTVVSAVTGNSNVPLLDEASHHRITELMLGLRSLDLSPYVRTVLASRRIWPSRAHRDAAVTLISITDAFFIPDHQHFLDVLEHNIAVLEFSGNHVTTLKPFLLRLGLESKLLSKSVRQTDSAEDTSMPDDELSNVIRDRADALFYCGEHFRVNQLPPERGNLHDLLRGIQVYRASDISTTYELNSQGFSRCATRSGLMRLTVNNSQLHLFVPRNNDSQREAFASCLPKEMIQFLDIPEEESWPIINSIFIMPVERLTNFLYIRGILLHNENEDSVSNLEINSQREEEHVLYEERRQSSSTVLSSQSSRDDLRPVAHTQVSERNHPMTPSTQPRNNSTNVDLGQDPVNSLSNIPPESGHRQDTPIRERRAEREPGTVPAYERSFEAPSSGQVRESLSDFQERVDNVIRHGREAGTTSFSFVANGPQNRGFIESGGSEGFHGPETLPGDSSTTIQSSSTDVTFDMAPLASALPALTDTTILHDQSSQSDNQDALSPGSQTRPARPGSGRVSSGHSAPRDHSRDLEIGFLGEQFIAEFLKQHLPDFDELQHWTSTLRIYAGFPEYTQGERTDLTYRDTNGHLRRLLRRGANDEIPAWLAADDDIGRPITFWLEVKTTTGVCETPFYVSPNQYTLMRSMAVSNSRPQNIYVLLRVYNIDGEPGVRVYIDPWTRAREGQLDFVASTWVVTPRG